MLIGEWVAAMPRVGLIIIWFTSICCTTGKPLLALSLGRADLIHAYLRRGLLHESVHPVRERRFHFPNPTLFP